jgi:hypothetical protein
MEVRRVTLTNNFVFRIETSASNTNLILCDHYEHVSAITDIEA